MTDHDYKRIAASREAFGWMDSANRARSTAIYWMACAVIGMISGGVVIVLMVLR